MLQTHIDDNPASLPALTNDVFVLIVQHLGLAQLAALARCCRILQHRIEPALYRAQGPLDPSPWRLERALQWACRHGRPAVIRKLVVAHGVPVTPRPEPLLRLAARSGCPATLQLVLDLLDGRFPVATPPNDYLASYGFLHHARPVYHRDLEADRFLRAMVKATAPLPLLKVFFDSRHARWNGGRLYGETFAQRCVWHAFDQPALPSVDVVQYLLSYDGPGGGVDVARLQPRSKAGCPLARAILQGDWALEALLVEAGVGARGSSIDRWPMDMLRRVVHFPIYAAAATMPRDGTAVVARLLAGGASALQTASIDHDEPRRPGTACVHHHWEHELTSLAAQEAGREGFVVVNDRTRFCEWCRLPAFVYLLAIESWDSNQMLRPTDGLRFWLAHGLSIVSGRLVRTASLELTGRFARRFGPTGRPLSGHSTLYMLLRKWGTDMLAEDEFYNLISLLAAPGLADYDAYQLYDFPYPRNEKARERWEECLAPTMRGDSRLPRPTRMIIN